MLHLYPVLHMVAQGTGCVLSTWWVAVRVSLYCASCLAESPQQDTVLYLWVPTRGEVSYTLPVPSQLVKDTYADLSVDDMKRRPAGNLQTILKLGCWWVPYHG